MPPKTKTSGLAGLRESMTKRYGDNRVVRKETAKKIEVIPTGSLALDHAMRTGGWVRGRLGELVGPQGVTKTGQALSGMREAQLAYPDLAVGYIDMEHTWTFEWAEKLGIDTDDNRLMYTKPRHTEDVSDQLREMMLSNMFSFIVVDSVGGMESAKAMYDKEASESTMGKNAQIISRMCKQVAVIADETNTAVLFINQLRANFSGMGGDEASGPKILKYATSMQVMLSRAPGDPSNPAYIKRKVDGDDIEVARQFKARVTRNKFSPAGRIAQYWFAHVPHEDFDNRVGIDQVDEAMVIGKKVGILGGSPGWYDIPGHGKLQKAKAKEFLRHNPDVVAEIRAEALTKVSGDVHEETEITFEDADD